MKTTNLKSFSAYQIPTTFLPFLKGGSCQDLENCHRTAEQQEDDMVAIMQNHCDEILGPTCN